jgi:DNA-binding PadR family transcriptional regulator
MNTLTNAETALLGLLSEKPAYPYQIEQEVEYRDMRSWTDLSMSTIYKVLRKLEKSGLVISKKEISKENRLRKQYSITGDGKRILKQKLENMMSEPEHMIWQLDLATYNCHLLDKKKIDSSLKKYITALEEHIDCYEKLEKFLKEAGCPNHRLALATRPIYLKKAEIEWAKSFLKQNNK